MESNKNTYQLRQGEKRYILITSLVGETIKLVCNSFDQSFTREFTLDELRSLDQLFYEIKSSKEAIDFIDKALRIQKVGVKEENGIIKIIFYITTKGIVHQIDIPLRKMGEKANISDNNFISNEQQNAQNQIEEYEATNYTGGENKKSENLENVALGSSKTNELIAEENTNFNANQFLGQTTTNINEYKAGGELETFNSLENINNTQDIAGLASSNNELISNQNNDNIEFNEDNVNTDPNIIAELTTNEQISADNIIQTNEIESTSNIDQLVEGAASSKNEYFHTNIEPNLNAESYMKTLPTKILPEKAYSGSDFEYNQSHYNTNSVPLPSFNTNQYMSNLESYQYTHTYDTTSIEPAVLPTPTLPIINDTEIASNDNIVTENNYTNAQYAIGQDFNLNQFTTQGSEGLETNEQLTNAQDLNLNQFTAEGTTINEESIQGQEFNFNQFTNEVTGEAEATEQLITDQNLDLNQFTTGTTEGTETTEQLITDQNLDLNQFTTGTTEGTETTEQLTTGQEFNLNQITTGATEGTETTEQFTTGEEFNLNQFTTGAIEGTVTTEQLTTGQEFNLNQFTTGATEGTVTTEQLTTGQEFNLNQFTTGTTEGTETTEQLTTGQEFNLNQITTGATEGTETTEQFTTGQEFNLNQFTTGTETTEHITTGQEFNLNQFTTGEGATNQQFSNAQDFSSNKFTTQDINLNQFGAEAITNASNEQFETQEYATNNYTSNYNDQYATQDFSTNQYNDQRMDINTFDKKQLQDEVPPVPLTQLGDFNNQGYNFEGTSTQNHVESQSTLVQPTFEQTNVDTNLGISSEENIFSSQVTFSLPKMSSQPEFGLQPQPTLDMNAYQEQPQQSQFDLTLFQDKSHYKVSEYKEPQYNIQEYTTTSPVPNYDDDRINKLEGDTNSLRNEHQQIQDKLNTLSGEINTYKNQLGAFEREKAASEVNTLKAENMAIKQQLSELNNLRNTAAEVNVLRSQLAELDPLRKKAAEVELLKSQLRELNDLKAKVAELNMVKSQLGELNQLKAQINQMSNLQNELNTLRMKAADAENLRRKLEEMETAKVQQEQEIENLRNSQQIELLKMKTSGMGGDSKQISFEEKTKNITVKGDIIQNVDELEMLTRKINKMNKKITLNLLYKATVDSDKASAFHERCDNAKSSLVLVETDKGKRFGGFTTCSWRGDCIDKKDEEAFVFSLDKMMIYDNIPGEDAVGCYPKFGPIFLGCQIRIYDNAFTRGGTTFEKGLNYNTEEDFELTGGDRVFGVKEIEVYEVIV